MFTVQCYLATTFTIKVISPTNLCKELGPRSSETVNRVELHKCDTQLVSRILCHKR